MKKSRFSEEKILAILKEAEAGVKSAELCRKNGISPATPLVAAIALALAV
jgi:putative transposase